MEFSRRVLLLGLGALTRAGASGAHALYFEPNRGQFAEGAFGSDQEYWQGLFGASRMRFQAKTLVGDPGPTGASAARRGPAQPDLALSLVGAAERAPVGEDKRQGRSDYYFHGDPKTFIRNTPHFYRLRYSEAWPGVDLVVRGWEGSLEVATVCSDASGLAAAGFLCHGAAAGRDRQGHAVLAASWGRIVLPPARDPGGRTLSGAWRLDGDGALRFA
ncbi:MAG: hypothetical protein GC160_18845 [Acidobacteria bacterium]|nr:hypothetical protein [Acidobacteriota bacterium]